MTLSELNGFVADSCSIGKADVRLLFDRPPRVIFDDNVKTLKSEGILNTLVTQE